MMNAYFSVDAANILYIWFVNIAGLRQGSGKNALGSWKVLVKSGIFCNQECGNPTVSPCALELLGITFVKFFCFLC